MHVKTDPGCLLQVAEQVVQGQRKAAAAATLRRANEAAVAPGKPANHDLLAAYNAYWRLEEAHGDPMRVKVRTEATQHAHGESRLCDTTGCIPAMLASSRESPGKCASLPFLPRCWTGPTQRMWRELKLIVKC